MNRCRSQALLEELDIPEQDWDCFRDPIIERKVGSTVEWTLLDFLTKLLKLAAYAVSFLVILGSAVISKGTLLFMTSQIRDGETRPYCNIQLGVRREFVVSLPRVERVAWMWTILFAYFVPELFVFFRSLRVCLFKTWKMPSMPQFARCFVSESLTAVGSAILAFCVLPELDVVKGVMLTNAVCFVPAVMNFFSRNAKEKYSETKIILDILSILAQASSFVVWPMVEKQPFMWLIPVSVIFISFGWWENYVSEDSHISMIRKLGKTKKKFHKGRYFMYVIISLWKCVLFFLTTLVVLSVKEERIDFLFEEFTKAFESHPINVIEIKPIITETNVDDVFQGLGPTSVPSYALASIWVFLINILSTYICYAFGKWACKVCIQEFGYAFPINLVVPTAVSILIIFCGKFNSNPCTFHGTIPNYLFFNVPPVYFLNDFLFSEHTWIWLLWLLSQLWITVHMWYPQNERLAKTERLYVRPMYDAFFIDQSLAMNRRRENQPNRKKKTDNLQDDNETTRIYACATMWQETHDEMETFLKSIMRLDEDQGVQRLIKDKFGIITEEFYEFETHIFFDDAFVRKSENDNDPNINKYVEQLIRHIDIAASKVHQTIINLKPPFKYVTPYGGRLIWKLPGNSLMIVHLKDKAKIRAKKRWSQVMYMYYLLGHRLMSRKDLNLESKQTVAENTYILALDGDIDFQPKAVHLLVNLMKRDKSLGAACGRIHPTGSGPMVWYQMFEYAIGHWLQKATEHVIGCVLCSPGCFTLFRGEALMDNGVMKKYTTQSTEARHYVQYDQGEDRWLCTLLLQKGWRIEYSAASDAFTHCPEGFNEFYKQRRRWIPSTIANILDLLMNYDRLVKRNDSISKLYILYHIVLMIGTILGPGTIFLMLVGAFIAAFDLDQWSSFLWNVIPILTYIIVCVLARSEIQLLFAGIISSIYGLIMMAVLVGVMLQISNDGPLAPSSLFFFCIAGEMIVTALLHPKEINCLIYGIVYYITVPSMYLLLIIYSVFNLNVISWGTREHAVVPSKDSVDPDEKDAPKVKEKKNTKNKILSLFGNGDNDHDSGSFEFSIANFMFCMHRKVTPESDGLARISEKLDRLEKLVRKENLPEDINKKDKQMKELKLEDAKGRVLKEPIYTDSSSQSSFDKPKEVSWLSDKNDGYYRELSDKENTFWEELLQKYLYPLDEKKTDTEGLKVLRDRMVFAFFMLNAIFVLVVFLLTLNKDILHVNWPFGVKSNFTFNGAEDEILIQKEYLQLEPIGFVFLIFFAALLVVQFIAMLIHRFGAFSEILTATQLDWGFLGSDRKKKLTDDEELENDPVSIVREMAKICEDVEQEYQEERAPGRRKTVMQLVNNSTNKKNPFNNMADAFRTRDSRINSDELKGRKSVINPLMFDAIKRRRTFHELKINSSNMVMSRETPSTSQSQE